MAAAADASTTGEATNYTLASGSIGNCSVTAPADNLFVALPPSEYDSGSQCGSYLQVTGPKGTVRVKVIDQCPECATGHIDLSRMAFADIGVLSQGIIPVTFSTVVDPPLPGPLTVQVKSGSSQYWLAVLIDNTGNPIAKVQASSAGGSTHDLTRTDYGFWIAQSGLGSGPFTITVTDSVGHSARFSGVALKPGSTQTTTAWMYGSGSGSGSVTAPTANPKTTPAAPATPSATPTPTPSSTPSTAVTTPEDTPTGPFSPTLAMTTSSVAGVDAAASHC